MPHEPHDVTKELFLVFTRLSGSPYQLCVRLPHDLEGGEGALLLLGPAKSESGRAVSILQDHALPIVLVLSDKHEIPKEVGTLIGSSHTVYVVQHDGGEEVHKKSVQEWGRTFTGHRFFIRKEHHNTGDAALALATFFSSDSNPHGERFDQLLKTLRGHSYCDSRSNDASELNSILNYRLTQEDGWETFKAEVTCGKLQKSWMALRLTVDVNTIDPEGLKAILEKLMRQCIPSSSS